VGDIINSQFHQRRITFITSSEIRYTLVTNMKTYEKNMFIILQNQQKFGRFQVYRSRRGRDRMVVRFTSTCAISAYHP